MNNISLDSREEGLRDIIAGARDKMASLDANDCLAIAVRVFFERLCCLWSVIAG